MQSMNFSDLPAAWLEARRFWWLLSLLLCGGLAAGCWLALRQPVLFVSEAKMLVANRTLTPDTLPGNEGQNDPEFLATQAAILSGAGVRARVRNSHPIFPPPLNQPVKVTATNLPQTSILLLHATGPVPEYTQQRLQQTMTEFLALRRELRLQRMEKPIAGLREESAGADADRQSAAAAFDQYQHTHEIATLQDQLSADTAFFASLRKRVIDLRLQRAQVSTGAASDAARAGASIPLDSGDKTTTDTALTTASPAEPDPRIAAAAEELASLKSERDRLLVYLKPQHPKIRALSARIGETERTLGATASQAKEDDKQRIALAERTKQEQLEAIDREINALNTEISKRQADLAHLNSQISQFQSLKARVASTEAASDKLRASLARVDLAKKTDQDVIEILENAGPATALPRQVLKKTLWSGLAGLVCGLLATLVLSASRQRFQTIGAVRRALPIPILGRIMADPWATRSRTVLDCDRNHLAFVESFRNLRSNLLNLPDDLRTKRCFSVTSAVPGEGKSVVSINLSIALAATSSRTLLVDGDLRRGKLHVLLETDSGPGFSDLVTDRAILEEVVRPTRMPKLFLMPTGPRIPNIAEQLLGFGMGALFGELGQHFDFILVDTPPVLAADDSTTIASKTAWTLFVVRLGYSQRQHCQLALEDLANRQVNVPGIVVNCVPRQLSSSHYYNKYTRRLEDRPFAALPAPPS